MPPKRSRRASPKTIGLTAGERLKRAKLTGSSQYSAWGWVGTEHSPHPLCPNKYVSACGVDKAGDRPAPSQSDDNVIVISDDDASSCSRTNCKSNPFCLNYLGQEKWEDEEKARTAYLKVSSLGEDPAKNLRSPGHPVGLKNLGATCYANAYLQVWYQDLTFRNGVYQCQLPGVIGSKLEESPIYQLQVTFTAMQEGYMKAFNPVKLVESLKLRTEEQQDAQEFSKLFMAHLDSAFKQQTNPTLKTLIPDQFQGKQVHGTLCTKCRHRSERESEFSEIELTIENNATLEDRIIAALQPEVLTGDNRYLCPNCDSLQDANRYTELRALPPVLHFSLLRFVYDLSSMERKKSKHAISFPKSIDMGKFLGSRDISKSDLKMEAPKSELYELRGVLLHKGASAYHGHYEAQVFDGLNQAWYQFNDEVVTKIGPLGNKASASNGNGTKAQYGNKRKARNEQHSERGDSKKRQRIDVDESDIEILPSPPSKGGGTTSVSAHISSKDAYMLVYVRIGSQAEASSSGKEQRTSSSSSAPIPPSQAHTAVAQLNDECSRACVAYNESKKQTLAHFDELRRRVMSVYRTWNLSTRDEDAVVVSRTLLETWLSRPLTSSSTKTKDNCTTSHVDASERHDDKPDEKLERQETTDDIVCDHGKLDPDKFGNMKVVTKAAFEHIALGWNISLPVLPSSYVCETCVRDTFAERLYQVQHPQTVAQFDAVSSADENEPGFWISKHWLKDWRLSKPRMHVASRADPAPDDVDFASHVWCEHGGLSPNSTARRRISAECGILLRQLFPTWQALSTDTEVCPVCEAEAHISKEDKRVVRKQAEEEKAKLKYMYDHALNGNISLLQNIPCAIISSQFVRSWRQWLLRPGEVHRPENVDSSQFLCEHGLLSLDPNTSSDMDSSVAVIKRAEWDILEQLYTVGPVLAIKNTGKNVEHEIAVCEACRFNKKSTFELTEITVRIWRSDESIPPIESESKDMLQDTSAPDTKVSRKTHGVRQSTRIRQGKRRRLTITKTMSVKDLKLLFQDEIGIPILSQRLLYHGQELNDNSATVSSLGILTNDTIDLKELDTVVLSDTDLEQDGERSTREGRGFGGTLLSSHDNLDSARTSRPSSPVATSRACIACTFDNPPDAPACTICDTPFPPNPHSL